MKTENPKGVALMRSGLHFSLKLKIISIFQYIFPKIKNGGFKQISWLSDIKYVQQYIPKQLITESLFKFDFSGSKKLSGKYSVRYIIEALLYPINNTHLCVCAKKFE